MGENALRDELRFDTAIRCAKAAVLLYSLKSAANCSHLIDAHQFEDIEKIQTMKIELVKEIKKHRNFRRWVGVLLFSYFVFVHVLPFVSYL